jgi:hypothetical protein
VWMAAASQVANSASGAWAGSNLATALSRQSFMLTADRMPDAMKIRRQTVEHLFGTLKAWMGAAHFLTPTLAKVGIAMCLQVLAYKMKRMTQIFGVRPLMAAIRA